MPDARYTALIVTVASVAASAATLFPQCSTISGCQVAGLLCIQKSIAEHPFCCVATLAVAQLKCSAYSGCHACMQGVCHRDLKLENTLLDGNPAPRLKICDFGYSKVCHTAIALNIRHVVSALNLACSQQHAPATSLREDAATHEWLMSTLIKWLSFTHNAS